MEMLNIFPNKENKYERNVSDMLANKNRLILKKIAAFLTLQCSSDWAIMLKSQEDLEEVLSMKLPDDPTKQVARQKAIEDIRKQIEECKKRMLENEKSKILEQEVSEFVAYATLGLRVEERVMQNYKVEKPHQAKGGKIYSEVGD
jgi:capsule polysaccharide export protein KpsE/RkpR